MYISVVLFSLKKAELFFQLRELLSHMTSSVASGHLSPSVHAYGCSTVTALLHISQASCSTFLDRGKSSLWLEANNFIPGASKSQAKGQGLGQQLESLANISYHYFFARVCHLIELKNVTICYEREGTWRQQIRSCCGHEYGLFKDRITESLRLEMTS